MRAFMGLFGGRECKQTWRKAKWNVSVRLKQLEIAKRKVGLKKEENKNVKLKEEDVSGAILPREREKCYRGSTLN